MPNDIRIQQNTQSISPQISTSDEIDLVQLLELIKANKWIVAKLAAACLFLGIFYSVFGTPIYKVDGLVQVEDQSSTDSMGQSLASSMAGGLGSALFGGTVQVQGEIQILQSRMVLDEVINKMNLLVEVKPRLFPLVGKTIARWNSESDSLAGALPGFQSFAWGGEKILVPTFAVPDTELEKKFKIEKTESGYSLYSPDGDKLGNGRVGESLTTSMAHGQVRIFVREFVARPGTIFYITHRAHEELLKDIDHKLDVAEQGKQSGVIQLTYFDNDRSRAVEFINNLEDAYLMQNVERRSKEAIQSIEFLETQEPVLKEKVDEAQAKLDAYQTRHGTVDVTQETAAVLQQSVDLETNRLQLLQDRQEAMQRFTAQHPTIKAIDEKLGVIDQKQASLKQDIERLPATQQDVLGLMRDVDVATQLYTALLTAIQQLQITKAGTTGNVRIVDKALEPFKKASPKALLVIPASLVFGLLFGCGFVLIQRALLRGVDDPSEVERQLGLATFGSIPYSIAQQRLSSKMKRAAGTNNKSNLLALTHEDDLVSEAIRSLRTSLHFAMFEATNNVLMITGPSPGLGKSFISANLAAMVAQSSKTIVVVDADLRRGYLHQYFGSTERPGLADWVSGKADENVAIRSTDVAGLSYVPRGVAPPNPAELLMHERFADIIKLLSARFDLVLIDAPPVLAVTDAAIIGRLAGCTLLTLKSAEHPMREIEDCVRKLSQARVNVRGVIFNQVGAKAASYGHGSYGYRYYRYDS